MVSTWSGYCNLLCTTVADIDKFQFLDFLKELEAENWVMYVIDHGGPRQSGFDTIGLLDRWSGHRKVAVSQFI